MTNRNLVSICGTDLILEIESEVELALQILEIIKNKDDSNFPELVKEYGEDKVEFCLEEITELFEGKLGDSLWQKTIN